jgi:hypothetical protein
MAGSGQKRRETDHQRSRKRGSYQLIHWKWGREESEGDWGGEKQKEEWSRSRIQARQIDG